MKIEVTSRVLEFTITVNEAELRLLRRAVGKTDYSEYIGPVDVHDRVYKELSEAMRAAGLK